MKSLLIVYELDIRSRDLSPEFTLVDCLFGTVKLIKNAQLNKYVFRGYGIGFDARSKFQLPKNKWSIKVVVFVVNNKLSLHADNKEKYMLVLAEGPIDGLDDTAIIEEDKQSINITKSRKNFFVDLQRNTSNSFLYTNGVKLQPSKAKDSEITPCRV